MDRRKELVQILNHASEMYYQKDQPIMSDHEFDQLYDELVQLEKETGIISQDSPTQRVGFTVLSNLTKIRHESRMLSLDKTKDPQKLKSWLEGHEGLLSWKMDGLTIVLRYREGKLYQAVTRGNGEIGEDITHNAKFFVNLPSQIPFSGELLLRGEGLISYKEFERINELLPDDEKYKNPRNLCSGTVRQLSNEVLLHRKVSFLAFALVQAEGMYFEDREEQLAFLKSLGFETVEYQRVTEDNIIDTVIRFEKKVEENEFPSDGLVLTYCSISYGKSLGSTSKFPRDSIAFKWADEMAQTRLKEIIWNTSRTGLINPIAVFDPVELEGTTVNRASVHNVIILEELQLGIGDKIKVYKANMIIPQIAENLTKSGPISVPKICPVCGGETEVRMLREGKALYCTNPNCQAQRVLSLAHFVSRDAMNIEGLSEETLKKFVDLGLVKVYPDIFRLVDHEEEIVSLEGFGKKSFDNLVTAIEKAKIVQLPNFIYALGINHVGLSNAKLLCKNTAYDLEKIVAMSQEELVAIDGFGEVIAHSIYKYFHVKENMELIEDALKYLVLKESEMPSDYLPLSGTTFVITGDLAKFENRRKLKEEIERLGGNVAASVTKKTNYLINNDAYSTSAKNKKAKELGVQVLTEEEFIEQFISSSN